MDRRTLLMAMGAAGLAGPAWAAADGDGVGRTIARDAWLYALPLIEMAATRARHLAQGMRLNHLNPPGGLIDHTGRSVTSPNNDTLYAVGWLDLTAGPVTLSTPDFGDRYWSVAVMDMYSNNNVVLGSRTVGAGAARFTLTGPHEDADPADAVRVATPHAWVLARVLVDGPEEVAAVQALIRQIRLEGPATPPPPAYATREASPADYFASVRRLLASDPPPATDTRLLRRCASLLGEGPPIPEAEVLAGVEQARLIARLGRGRQAYIQGWSYPPASLGNWGQDYLVRGVVALSGLAALPLAEATYLRPQGDGEGLFHGDGLYRLSLPASVPVNGFWSLSMYEATPDGQYFFTDNPLNRYAIGDRSKGLARNADGTLDLWIGRADPGGARTANWLPAPKAGPYTLTFRAYLPGPDLINGRWRLPPIVAA